MRLHLPNGLLKRHEADLSDLTDSIHGGPCAWSADEMDVLVCPFDPEPTVAEQVAIRRRLVTVDAADEAHLYGLLDAVADPATPAWARLTLQSELTSRYGEPATT